MIRKGYRLLFLLAMGCAVAGCETSHYYHQAISGEYEILKHRQPIAALLTDPKTDPKLKQKFELIIQLRAFAERELKLPVNKHYLTYVDLQRPFAVWNVHAAPVLSLEPKKWWYPLVGRLKYRGYFLEKEARAYGERLAQEGEDVYVEGVEAYSTLGWFADPLMNTFIYHAEPDLAETIFHELTHQRVFLGGDTDFNEAFATTVAEEGVRRWYLAKGDEPGYQRYLTELQRNRQFVELIMNTRARLLALYGDPKKPNSVSSLDLSAGAPWMLAEKARIISELRSGYEKLKASWGGYAAYDGWFGRSLNNAQLNTIAVYYLLVPGFQKMLRSEGGDLEHFYKAVRDLRKLGKEERHRYLQKLGASPERLGLEPVLKS